MISPFTELTIGQMYTDTPGYISALTYNVMDTGTYETVFAKLPKYIQVAVTFQHIGKRLPSATQKHFELPWVAEQQYLPGAGMDFITALKNPELFGGIADLLTTSVAKRREGKLNVLNAASNETRRVVDENEKFFDDILAETGDYETVEFVE